MSEILVRTLTRHRDVNDKFYMKDWTAFDVCQIMPDGYFSTNKHKGAKGMGIVLCVDGKIPADYAKPEVVNDELTTNIGIDGRSKYIVDLTKALTNNQLKDCFNHDLLVDPIIVNKSYLDLLIPRSERTELHHYDKSGSFDNETVDVGPNGHPDANTFFEFESNVAISAGSVIGDCDEDMSETAGVYVFGCGSTVANYVEFKASGSGKHQGVWSSSYQQVIVTSGYAFQLRDAGVRLTGLQINSGDNRGINGYASIDDVRISGCLIKGNNTNSQAGINLAGFNASGVARIWNNVVYDMTGAESPGIILADSDLTVYIYANIIKDCTRGIQLATISQENIKSNLIDCTDCWYGTFTDNDANNDYNYISQNEDHVANGSHGAYNQSFTYDNEAGDYFYPDSGDPGLENGADLDSDGNCPVTGDIVGTARHATTPDIGAFEYVAVGGNAPTGGLYGSLVGPMGGPISIHSSEEEGVQDMGDYSTTETVHLPFNTFTSDDPAASCTVTNLAVGDIEIHKDGAVAQRTSDNGVTVSINFDGITGNHMVHIDLSDNSDAGFYASGSRYSVRLEGITVDGGALNVWIGSFSIGCVMRPTTAGRTLDVNATGEAGLDLDNTSGTLAAAQFAADFLTEAKIADNAIAAEHLAPGAIDNATFAADVGSTAHGTNIIALAVRKILEELNLDHLMKVAVSNRDTIPEVVDDTVLANIMTKTDGDTSDFDHATDSLEAIRDKETDIETDTGELQTDWVNGGRLDLLLDSVISLLDDARAEPGQGNPPVNADAMTKLDYLYKWTRNQKDNDGTTTQFYNDAGAVVDHKQTTSEAGGTVTKAEIVTGP